MQIPIISIQQPWAAWVALGWKTIETRTHNRFTSLGRRTIGIHASNRWDPDWLRVAGPYLTPEQIERTRTDPYMMGSGILCKAFVEKYRILGSEEAAKALIECETLRYGLFLSKVERIEPVMVKGRQGIWYAEGFEG